MPIGQSLLALGCAVDLFQSIRKLPRQVDSRKVALSCCRMNPTGVRSPKASCGLLVSDASRKRFALLTKVQDLKELILENLERIKAIEHIYGC